MKFFWIVILLLLSPLLALLFFRKNGSQAAPSDKTDALLGHTGPAVLPEESEYSEEADDESAEALFRQWLGVIYRDKPEEVDAIIANLEENADDEEELDFGSIIESFFLLHNNLNDTEHLFSVDWKDGESFIDFIADIADRFNAKLEWSEDQMEEGLPDQLALAAYPVLLAAGAVADDASVSASSWAKRIKDAGSFRLGGVQTSTLFAQLDETDGKLRGFDAGLAQLLVRYILGDESKYDFTQVTSSTRESVLQNDQVDAVFATYSITDDRKKAISFAGPYYTSQQGILVAASNSDINSVDDLADKNVAVQSGSSSITALQKAAPQAEQTPFNDHNTCLSALETKQVDAYVVDESLLLSAMQGSEAFKIVGEPFTQDPYGIGLPQGSDAKAFVNAFLQTIYDDGTWEAIWRATIGAVTGGEAPEPPAMEETTSTMGAISMAGAVPTPGTRRATSSAARRESGWPMASTAWRTASWISFSTSGRSFTAPGLYTPCTLPKVSAVM